MRRLAITLVTAVVLLVLFIVLFTFIRRPYEVVLLDRFGTLIPEAQQKRLMYNWYFKLPTDGVVRIDQRLHLYPGSLQEVVTKGSAPISVQTYAAWRIVDAVKFYKKTNGSDFAAQTTIDGRVRSLIGTKLGEHTLDELFNMDVTKVHSEKIEEEISREATDGSPDGKIPGLKDLGIEIAQVGFSRMAFPTQTTEAVYGRMVSELNTKARALESEGAAEAKKIQSQGELDAANTRAAAKTQADTIRGQADHDALAILFEVQKTDSAREFYQYWKSLDFLKASLAKNTILVLSADSPFLSLGSLFQAPKGGAVPATQPTPSSVLRSLPAIPDVSTSGK